MHVNEWGHAGCAITLEKFWLEMEGVISERPKAASMQRYARTLATLKSERELAKLGAAPKCLAKSEAALKRRAEALEAEKEAKKLRFDIQESGA